MNAQVRKLDCHGRTIWRLMATRKGQIIDGIGHMLDYDHRDDAEAVAISTARRNRWALLLETFLTPGKPASSTRSFSEPPPRGV